MEEKILCLYCTRTGTTKDIMEKLADKLGAELVEVTDGKDRDGKLRYFLSGYDAMKKNPPEIIAPKTRYSIRKYDKIILGTPVWAGHCSSMAKSFLMRYGTKMPEKTYLLITHMAPNPYVGVFDEMNSYLAEPCKDSLSISTKAMSEEEIDEMIDSFAASIRSTEA